MFKLKNENLNNILNIDNFSKKEIIKSAFRQLSLKYHPDKENSEVAEKYKNILMAYEILIDPVKKEMYDNTLITNQEENESLITRDNQENKGIQN